MADTQQTIDIIFNGIDRTATAISSVISNVEGGVDKIGSIAAPIADVTTGLLKLEGALLSGGAALTLFAVKTAGDFDTAFREIATLIDLPIESLTGFRQEILDYASTSTQSLEQVTGSIYGAISAGVAYTDSVATVAQAEKLAIASKADLSDTLVLLVSSLNAYGKGAETAEQYSDALFTTVKQGQTTLPELAASMSQVTSLAASVGVPFETILSAVAALTAAGAPTSSAITQIRGALSAIVKPSGEAARMAEELGIQFNTNAISAKGFEGVLQDVYTATGGNTDQMAKLFGSVEGLSGVLTLTSTGAEKFADTLAMMQDSAGATGDAYQKMADGMTLGNERSVNAIKTLLVAIGDPLLDEFGGVQQAIAAIFKTLESSVSSGALSGVVAQIEAMAQDLESLLRRVAQNLPEALEGVDFSKFFEGVEAVKDAIIGVFDGADLGSAEGLRHAIDVIGTGFLTLGNFTGSVVEALGPFLRLAADIAETLAKLDPEVVAVAGSIGGLAIAAGPVTTAVNGVLGATRLLATALAGSGGLAAALAAVSGSPAVIAAGLTALGYAAYKTGESIYGLTADGREYYKLQGEIVDVEKERAETSGKVADRLSEISKETGLAITNMGEFNRLEKEGAIIFDEAAGKWIAAGSAVQQATSGLIDWGAELKSITIDVDENAAAAKEMAAGYYEISGTTPELAARMADLESGMQATTDVMEDATTASEELEKKMLELASNERIKAMEFGVDLQIAQLEAETKQFTSMMDSISNSATSTGDTLVGLTGLFLEASKGPGWTAQDTLLEEMEKENERRDKVINAQLDYMAMATENLELRNRALASGDAMITVDGSGLAPEIEAFMWKILEMIQVRANEEASEFLLGWGQ